MTGTVTRSGGFAGDVAISVDGVPTGVTGTVTTMPVAGTSTAVVSISVLSTATAGTYTLTVHATGSGVTAAAATFTLTITGAASGFTVTATPAAASVAQNGSNNTGYVKATRTGGFAGTITYSITGAPTGLTATATVTAVPDSIAIGLAATSSLAAGVYPLVIHANSTGLAEQTTPLSVTVTATAGSAVRLDYSTCATAAKPIWVAMQDGTGAWTRVTGSNDVYNFNIASTKGGIAVVTQGTTTFNTSVQLFTQAEAAAYTGTCNVTGNKTVTGTTASTVAGDRVTVAMGGALAILINPTTTFSLTTVGPGTYDLVASKQAVLTSGTNDRMLLRRDLNIASGGSVGAALDVTGAESFAPATATLTAVGSVAGETLLPAAFYATGAACTLNATFLSSNISAGTNAFTIEGVPTASQRATDFHVLFLTATTGAGASRSVIQSNHTLAARSLTFGAALNAATVTAVAGSGYKRLQVSSALPLDYTGGSLGYSDALGNQVTTNASAGYLGNSTLAITTPDFTGAAGLLTSWFPLTTAAVNWTVTGTSALTTGLCFEGASLKTASATGTN